MRSRMARSQSLLRPRSRNRRFLEKLVHAEETVFVFVFSEDSLINRCQMSNFCLGFSACIKRNEAILAFRRKPTWNSPRASNSGTATQKNNFSTQKRKISIIYFFASSKKRFFYRTRKNSGRRINNKGSTKKTQRSPNNRRINNKKKRKGGYWVLENRKFIILRHKEKNYGILIN